MAENGGGPEVKAPKNSTTEASKRFVGKMAHGAKEAGITVALSMVPGGAFALGVRQARREREAQTSQAGLTTRSEAQQGMPEAKKSNPTKASRGFLSKFKDRLLGDNEGIGIRMGRVAISSSLAREAFTDAMQGNYPSAVVEGVIAAVSAVSFARLSLRVAKDAFKKNN